MVNGKYDIIGYISGEAKRREVLAYHFHTEQHIGGWEIGEIWGNCDKVEVHDVDTRDLIYSAEKEKDEVTYIKEW